VNREVPDLSRVAELIVTHPGGKRRGSGYRVTATAVLTAKHVVADAVSVEVRFNPDLPGQWRTHAVPRWISPSTDVAVLSITPPADETPLVPTLFGRLGDRPAVVEVAAVGFPLWKIRTRDDGSQYRDSHLAPGTVSPLSNWREGTLEVTVSPVPPVSGYERRSPWEGMSGAAVWVKGHIVGVVAELPVNDGGRLTAARVDRAFAELDPPEAAELEQLLTLPPDLPEVSGNEDGNRLSHYLAAVAQAPGTSDRPDSRETGQDLGIRVLHEHLGCRLGEVIGRTARGIGLQRLTMSQLQSVRRKSGRQRNIDSWTGRLLDIFAGDYFHQPQVIE
jgi:hypothetical protein